VTGKTRAVVAEKVRELEPERDAGTVDATASTGCGPNISTSYTALLDDGYSPASVLRYHRILSRALTVAVQRGHVARNVAALVDPPAQRHSDIATALDLGEARAVLGSGRSRLQSRPTRPSPWPSVSASPRRRRCSGRTSTCSPAHSPCGAASTGSEAAGSSTRSPRPGAASARWPAPVPGRRPEPAQGRVARRPDAGRLRVARMASGTVSVERMVRLQPSRSIKSAAQHPLDRRGEKQEEQRVVVDSRERDTDDKGE
jgi:hypothetical protein